MWITSSLDTIRTPTRVALGNFDGIHRGHQRVIEPILPFQRRGEGSDSGESSRLFATVTTFHPHPQEFFTGQPRDMLTPLDEKIAYLEKIGVEQLVLLPFTAELAAMTPEAFVEGILANALHARWISVGQDFCFGRHRSGTTDRLKAIALEYGITVETVPLYTENGERISSSAIRQALAQGEVAVATRLLGRPYTLVGTVVAGQRLGRKIGFPTANLQLPPHKFVPRQGVYGVQVGSSSWTDEPFFRPGVMNIGNRPTVDGHLQTIEVYVLDWSGDLYNQELTVSLTQFLRPEQKFASLDELKAQIQADCDLARSL